MLSVRIIALNETLQKLDALACLCKLTGPCAVLLPASDPTSTSKWVHNQPLPRKTVLRSAPRHDKHCDAHVHMNREENLWTIPHAHLTARTMLRAPTTIHKDPSSSPTLTTKIAAAKSIKPTKPKALMFRQPAALNFPI